MTLQNFIDRVTRALPQATGGTISQASIIFEINRAPDQINLLCRHYWATIYYNLPALTAWQEFSCTQTFPGYLGPKKTGLWFFDTNDTSHYIYAKTKRWLDNHILNWRDNQGASIPTWSYIEQDTWFLYPYVNVAGCQVSMDCLITATPMTSGSNYPWTNGTTELTTFRPFDDAICSYAIWKLAPAVFDKESRNVNQQQFLADVKVGMEQVKNRENLATDLDYFPSYGVPEGFLPRGN